MSLSEVFELIGKGVPILAACAAGWWGLVKWRKREEHFPRVYLEVSANFLGVHEGKVVTELIAVLENKGVVPLKISNFTFKLLGLNASDPAVKGPPAIRGQLQFPQVLEEGEFVPTSWNYSFVYPGVTTEYNFVTAIPVDVAFIRMQGDFEYLEFKDASHHAAKVFQVPKFHRGGCQ